jgi:hypothetical protein
VSAITTGQNQSALVGIQSAIVGSLAAPSITPAVDLLRGIDLPLLRDADVSGNDCARLDSDMEAFAARHGKALNRRLLKYLKAKLRKQPSTRHELAGRASAAYLRDAYRHPLNRLSPTEWPASILPIFRDGHAVGLFVYPDLPAPADLDLIRDAVRLAKRHGRGMWNHRPPVLQPCEYRWIADTITGQSNGPELYCGDYTNRKLYLPQQYYLVAEECRVWFCSRDADVAAKLRYNLQ